MNISFDLSEKIDEQGVKLLHEVKNAADTLGIPFIVVGAYARDILLKHCYGIPSPRMTMDVDLGVEVTSWDQFDQLVSTLLTDLKFSSTTHRHKFHYGTTQIDIVPFGDIADAKQLLSWPPEHQITMSLLGFQEAYDNSIEIRLCSEPLLDVKIPSLPALAVMKLIAWRDRTLPDRKKDAQDLLFIMCEYSKAGNFERLYAEELELLQAEGFDNEMAGIMPIPLIPPCDSDGSRHLIPRDVTTLSERSDAGDFSSFS